MRGDAFVAGRYVRLLPAGAHDPVRLIAYSLGCRIAYRMACTLEKMGKIVQLVLLDGPFGPDCEAPPVAYHPRMGGMAKDLIELIHSTGKEFGQRKLDCSSGLCSVMDITQKIVDALAHEIVSSHDTAAAVAIALLELPDRDEALMQPSKHIDALLVTAEAGFVERETIHGTTQMAHRFLPGFQHHISAGGHFDFAKISADAIAVCIDDFWHAL